MKIGLEYLLVRRDFVIFIFSNYKRKASGFVVIPARGGGRGGGTGTEAGRVAILVAAQGLLRGNQCGSCA